jgi:hypothetical protein
MAYEVFERVIKRVTTPMLSISSLGRLSFNTAASDMLHRMAVADVLLMWDRENRKIAIRSINKKDDRSYRMRFSRRNKAAGFAAKAFLEYIGYDYSESRSFPCVWNEDQGMFEISLTAEAFKPSGAPTKPQAQRFPRLPRAQRHQSEGEKQQMSAAV